MNKALFIDRDGILNELVFKDGAPHSPINLSEVKEYPEAKSLPKLKKLGFLFVLVTNQPDIERGIISIEFIEKLHSEYKEKYALDAIYCSPYADNKHPMKKPNPGMFLQAAKDFDINFSKSFHLGDTENDTIAAKRCNLRSILWSRHYNSGIRSDFRINNFLELETLLSSI